MASLGEIVRGEAVRYLQTHVVTPVQQKAMRDIAGCGTAAMGCVALTCAECGEQYHLFRSCGNRSCPDCQFEARAQWLAARREELLPVPYLHVVFNVPPELYEVGRCCPEEFYEVLVRAAGQAIVDVGLSELKAQCGCLVQLHTWGQNLAQHPHCHCVVPCGGFSEDGTRWVSFAPGDLPPHALVSRFRGLLCEGLRSASQRGELHRLKVDVDELLAKAMSRRWSVYAKPPYGGPEKLLEYLAQSMYRVAISNRRIVAYENGQVTFTVRDYHDGGAVKKYTLEAQEFLRRFLQHVPPKGFVRMRSYGFLGNRRRKEKLEHARQLIRSTYVPATKTGFEISRLCPTCYARKVKRMRTRFAQKPSDWQSLLARRAPPDPLGTA